MSFRTWRVPNLCKRILIFVILPTGETLINLKKSRFLKKSPFLRVSLLYIQYTCRFLNSRLILLMENTLFLLLECCCGLIDVAHYFTYVVTLHPRYVNCCKFSNWTPFKVSWYGAYVYGELVLHLSELRCRLQVGSCKHTYLKTYMQYSRFNCFFFLLLSRVGFWSPFVIVYFLLSYYFLLLFSVINLIFTLLGDFTLHNLMFGINNKLLDILFIIHYLVISN